MAGLQNSLGEILVIEDDEDLYTLVKFVLENEGFKVRVESDGMKALNLLASDYQPDLILLDIMLPGIDGFQVLRKIKSNPNIQHIPVIIVSARVAEKDVRTGLELGGTTYLKKPLDISDLIECVGENLKEKKHYD